MSVEKLVLLLFGAVFFLIGLAFTLGGSSQIRSKRRWLKRAARAKGVVWEMITETGIDLDRSYHPKIAFRASDKRRYYFTSTIGSGRPRWKVGGEVEVVYDPEEPSRAEIAGSIMWIFPIAFVIAETVFLGFAVLMLVGALT